MVAGPSSKEPGTQLASPALLFRLPLSHKNEPLTCFPLTCVPLVLPPASCEPQPLKLHALRNPVALKLKTLIVLPSISPQMHVRTANRHCIIT